MAGIGFSLKRLFSKKGVLALCRAYGYAGVICAGPMLLGVTLLVGMALISRLAGIGQHNRELMNVMLTYSLLWSLTVTSWMNMTVTRYIADMIYEEKPRKVLPAFYGSCAIMLTFGFVSYGIFLHFSGVELKYQLLCIWFSLVLVVVWTETIFLTALKDYKSIVLAFAISLMTGFLAALIIVILGKASVVTLMLCVILAYGMLMVWYYKLLLDYFPKSEGSKFSFLRWIDKYPTLGPTGGFLNIGLFAHLVIMYFGPLREQVEGLFYGAPMHDVPALMAFFSILITTVNFVTSVEVRFYPKYRNYYSLFNENGSISDIEQAGDEMISVLRQELTFAGHKQLISTILFVVLGSLMFEWFSFGMTDLALGIYRFLCAGYGVYAISNSIMLILEYFEDYAGALIGTFAFALVSVVGTVYSILFVSPTLYGLGFFFGGLVFYFIVWLRLEWYVRRLPYFLLCRQALVPDAEHGFFTSLCNWLDERQERIAKRREDRKLRRAGFDPNHAPAREEPVQTEQAETQKQAQGEPAQEGQVQQQTEAPDGRAEDAQPGKEQESKP